MPVSARLLSLRSGGIAGWPPIGAAIIRRPGPGIDVAWRRGCLPGIRSRGNHVLSSRMSGRTWPAIGGGHPHDGSMRSRVEVGWPPVGRFILQTGSWAVCKLGERIPAGILSSENREKGEVASFFLTNSKMYFMDEENLCIIMVKEFKDIRDCADRIYKHFDKSEEGFVTIILGAGASASVGTKNLISYLTKNRETMFDINANVHFGKDYKKCTLEELFSIYSKINGAKRVHEFLSDKKFFKRADNISPTQSYEFIAHLVNHKLINNIISTNFDEELEISLDDEIGRRQLYKYKEFKRV